MRLAAARPRVGGSSIGLFRVSAVALPSPQRLSTKRAAVVPVPPRRKNEPLTSHAARRTGPIVAASASPPSPSSVSSSSGDDDDTCEVYVTPEGEVVEVRVRVSKERGKEVAFHLVSSLAALGEKKRKLASTHRRPFSSLSRLSPPPKPQIQTTDNVRRLRLPLRVRQAVPGRRRRDSGRCVGAGKERKEFRKKSWMSFLSTSAFFRPSHGFSFFLSFHSSRLPLSPPLPLFLSLLPPPLSLFLSRSLTHPKTIPTAVTQPGMDKLQEGAQGPPRVRPLRRPGAEGGPPEVGARDGGPLRRKGPVRGRFRCRRQTRGRGRLSQAGGPGHQGQGPRRGRRRGRRRRRGRERRERRGEEEGHPLRRGGATEARHPHPRRRRRLAAREGPREEPRALQGPASRSLPVPVALRRPGLSVRGEADPALLGLGNSSAHALLRVHLDAAPVRVSRVVEGGRGAAEGAFRRGVERAAPLAGLFFSFFFFSFCFCFASLPLSLSPVPISTLPISTLPAHIQHTDKKAPTNLLFQ